MSRILLAATLTVVMPALVLSQAQRKQVALSQNERKLKALSRKAVAKWRGNEIIVANRFTSTATVQGK